MATEAQIEANRENAEFSTGPRNSAQVATRATVVRVPTEEEGKSRSSRNAVKFGIYSAADFVRPDEVHTYEIFCQRFKKDLRPEGALEQVLTAEIIHAAWRLRRCAVAESEMEWAEGEPDPLLSRTQAGIDRARAQAQRQLLRATNELRRIQTERQLRNEFLPKEFPINAIGGLTSIKEIQLFLKKTRNRDTHTIADLTTKRTQSESPEPVHAASAAFPAQQGIPRSAPCPCGSGLKYKRCCGRNAPAVLPQAA